MITQFVQAPDGVRLAYDVVGSGPILVLLHGLGPDRTVWHEAGWPTQLADSFTVITLDLRGHGQSDQPTTPDAYHIDRFRDDILSVVTACGAESFRLFGWSFGATIGLQLAAMDVPLTRAVIAGTSFGQLFTEENLGPYIEHWKHILAAQSQGALDQIALTEEERVRLDTTNMLSRVALWQGLLSWPSVEPARVRRPILVYTGTNDHVVEQLTEYQPALEQYNLPLHIFADLDHGQLVDEIETIYPVIYPFLTRG